MGPLWAEEVLRDRGGSLSAKDLRAVVLLATGDEGAADRAFAERVHEEMRAGRVPEV